MINKFLVFSFGILGLTALIFQVVFAKNLVLLFGLTAPAIATVLAVYFLGMALGSFIFGRIADLRRLDADQRGHNWYGLTRIKKLYIGLFFLTGIYGFCFPLILKLLNKTILVINQIHPLSFSGFNFFAFVFSFLLLILPAIMFGAGFPVISKILIYQSESLGKKISLLYFINTLGGVSGAALAGFWLIPAFGNNATIFSAAGLNLIVAGLLFSSFFRKNSLPEIAEVKDIMETAEITETNEPPGIKNKIFLYTLFLTGFLALALEILYTKILILFIGSSTYAFSLILVIFLLGIAIGSWVVSLFIDQIKRGYAYFGLFLGLIGFWLFLTAKFFERVPFWYLDIFKSYESFDLPAILSSQALIVLLVIFPATFLMGMVFPLGIKLAGPDLKKLGQGVGQLYFANTFGGVLGSLAAGFLFLPALGYNRTLTLILLSYFLLGGIFIVREKELERAIKGVIIFFLIFWAVFSIFSSPWSKKILSLGVFPYAKNYLELGEEAIRAGVATDEIVFYKEGLSQVGVIKRKDRLLLRINGKTDASNSLEDLEHEILTGALPLTLHPEPKDVLLIGLGSGISLGSVTQFDEPEKIDMVEIDPTIVKAADYFKNDNHDALNDPRVKTILADGRNYLYLTDKKYDVISSQPSNLWVSGNSYLFTKEYYELAKSHLKENGLMFQWIQIYGFDQDNVKSILKTFQEIFPNTYLFDNVQGGDLFLVGALGENSILNFAEVEKKFRNEKIKNEFARLYIKNPYELLSYFVSSGDRLKAFSQNSEIHSDNRPFLEFSAPKSLYKNTSPETLKGILSLRQSVNPADFIVGGDKKELSKYFDFRQKLIPIRIAIAAGDLPGALNAYKEAAATGLSNNIVEENIFYMVYLRAEALRKAERESEAEALWERFYSISNGTAMGEEK